MKNYNTLLRWSFLGGAIYFFLVAAAHLFNLKIPFLFIYFNVPSHAYQDLIISFLAFGWGMFLFSGYSSSKHNELITAKYIIIAGFAAVAGLVFINSYTDFKKFNLDIIRGYFWIETFFIFLYVLWLLLLYWKARANRTDKTKTQSLQGIFNEEQKQYAKWR